MCVGRGRSSTYGRSPRSVSAECVRSYIRQNLNYFSPPVAGYPFRLPVRASVQVTSWRGPHFPRQRLNQGCPGTHCLRFAEDSKRLGSCNQTMIHRKLTQVLMPNTCLETTHVLRFSSQNPRRVCRKGTRTASSASHGWGGLWCAIGDECGTALRQTED